jgi:hypothetical protein
MLEQTKCSSQYSFRFVGQRKHALFQHSVLRFQLLQLRQDVVDLFCLLKQLVLQLLVLLLDEKFSFFCGNLFPLWL